MGKHPEDDRPGSARRGGQRLLREHRIDQIPVSTPSGGRSGCSTSRTCSTCASGLAVERAGETRHSAHRRRGIERVLIRRSLRRCAEPRARAAPRSTSTASSTDGRIVYGRARDEELQIFHVHDGIALVGCAARDRARLDHRPRLARHRERARELGVRELFMRVEDKRACPKLQARLGVTRDETVAMGDDLPDLALRGAGGLRAPVARAPTCARARASSRAPRGRGAVRELAERSCARAARGRRSSRGASDEEAGPRPRGALRARAGAVPVDDAFP